EALAYPTVSYREASVSATRVIPGGFSVAVEGEMLSARRLILATGVVDVLPEIPGLAERWGTSVFHCPYCHGYELNRGRIGVVATTPTAVHLAMLAPEWGAPGQSVFFLNGALEPDAEQLAQFAARKIGVERELVVAIEGELPEVAVRLQSGRVERFVGLFLAS